MLSKLLNLLSAEIEIEVSPERFVFSRNNNTKSLSTRIYLFEATQKHKWFPNIDLYDAWSSVERIEKKKFAFFLHPGKKENQGSGRPEFAYKWS